MMRSIVSASLKNRVLVAVIAAVLVVVGVRQLGQTPVDVWPEFTPPYVEIQTEALGLSAQEVEQLITLGLEQDLLNGVPWLRAIRSESVTGLSSIVLVFQPGTDVMRARQMVSERLTQAFALPHVSKPPTMLQPMSSASRVMLIGLSSQKLSLIQMSVLARWTIAPRLQAVPGVANVAIWGQRDRQLQVLVDPKRLHDRHVSLLQVLETTGNALWVSSLSFVEASTPGTGGFIDNANQRLGVRHILPIVSPEGLAQVPIENTGVRLNDVANVVEDHQPLIGDALSSDGSSLLLVVDKFPGANTLDVTQGLRDALTELRPGMTGVDVDPSLFSPAAFIEAGLKDLGLVAMIGFALLAIALTVFYGEWRPAAVSLIAIVLSLAIAGLVLSLRGATLNVMALAGFAMAIGVVVDDAIIHVANVMRRLREDGKPSRAATIILDTIVERRVALLFGTLIVLLAIVPAYYFSGLPGSFFRPIAVSYGLAVLASLVVALLATPGLCLLFLGKATGRAESSLMSRLERGYAGRLSRIMARPGLALVTVLAFIVIGLGVLPFARQSTLPSFKERDFLIHLRSAPGTSLPEMNRITGRLGHELRALPGVRNVGAHVGRAVFGDQVVEVSSADMWVSLDPAADYDATTSSIQRVVAGYPGLHHEVQTYLQRQGKGGLVAGRGDSMIVRVYGDADQVLRTAATNVSQAISGVAGIAGTRLDLPVLQPIFEIEADLAAAQRAGIKPGDVRRSAATMFSGLQVGNLFEEQKVFDVVVWSQPDVRHSLSSIRDLEIDTPGGGHVRLGDVARVRLVSTPSVIRHEAVKRYVDIVAAVRGRDPAAVASDVRARLLSVPLPLEYHAQVLGDMAEHQTNRSHLLVFAVAVLIGILFLMQAALGSWRLAGLAFLSLPAALGGGLVAGTIFGGVISLGSIVALFALLGITARNAVMLMKRFQQLDQQQPFGSELVLRGARDRLAPILMTASATVLLILPTLFMGDVPGLEILRPMTIVMLGGLITSTVTTVFMVPALYLALGVSGVRELELEGPMGMATPAMSAG